MNDLVKGYFKDYSKHYTVIDNIPTSPFGISLAKRCKWCYSIIYPKTRDVKKDNKDYLSFGKRLNIMSKVFCTKDCQEDYGDWSYFRNLRYQRERARSIGDKKPSPDRVDRKEYLRVYHLENKEKRKQQMKEQRIKRLNKIKK